MANPRNTVSYEGIGHHAATHVGDSSLAYDATQPFGTAKRWAPVIVNADGTVGVAGDGVDGIIGSVYKVEGDGKVVVEDGQYVRFKGEVAEGSKIVGATANGVKAGTAGAGIGRVVASGAGSEVGAGFSRVKMY